MPKISVIIPCYKVEKYLSECLDSVLAQTFTDFEVICVNDGSPDKCADILAEYARKDRRIKILSQENQGLSVARNNGLKQAAGDYVCFIDSDDFIHPQYLELAYAAAQKYRADLVSFDFCKGFEEGLWQKRYMAGEVQCVVSDTPFFLGTTKEKNRICYNVWTKLYRRQLLDGVEFIPHIHFEDFPHTYAVLAKNPRTAVLHEKLYFYRINPMSISHQNGSLQQLKDYKTGIDFVCNLYDKPDKQAELAFLKKTFIPNIIKHQLGRSRRSSRAIKPEMYKFMAAELHDLNRKGFFTRAGHKWSRYWLCRYLMWRYK